jgi:putative endonuclease
VFYVYVLSTSSSELYIGYTSNVKKRVEQHISGQSKSTSGSRIWKLVYYEAYRSKEDTVRRERALKNKEDKLSAILSIE